MNKIFISKSIIHINNCRQFLRLREFNLKLNSLLFLFMICTKMPCYLSLASKLRGRREGLYLRNDKLSCSVKIVKLFVV